VSLGQLYHGADSVGVGAKVVGDAVGGVGANVVGDAVGGVGAEVVGVEVGLRVRLLLLLPPRRPACASKNSFVTSAPSSALVASVSPDVCFLVRRPTIWRKPELPNLPFRAPAARVSTKSVSGSSHFNSMNKSLAAFALAAPLSATMLDRPDVTY